MQIIALNWFGPFRKGTFHTIPSQRRSCLYVWMLNLERAKVLYGGKSGGVRGRDLSSRVNEHLRDFCAGQYWRYLEEEIDNTSKPKGAATFDDVNRWIARAVHHIENIEFYYADCAPEILAVAEKHLISNLLKLAEFSQGKILCDNEKRAGSTEKMVELNHASNDQSRSFVQSYLVGMSTT